MKSMKKLLPPISEPPPSVSGGFGRIPSDEECERIWDEYGMLDNIKHHSRMVAMVATHVAVVGAERGLDVCPRTTRASALLHDIAKTYTIHHGGNHSQLGASWAVELTGNPALAQGVIHHVFWPFNLDVKKNLLPMCVIYGDKRVSHDQLVGLEERFVDLLDRYGKTQLIRDRIGVTHDQAINIERELSELLGEDLRESTFDRGRLVQRA